ncbi:hypothetical protein Ssi03_41900 [Sphaerisporangium siamense]|uniref:Uncharacterized protein n=1 Tax=Sphaerisporangium siamense TaxID=795645 RepID=A0A7W7DF36_9ACTN|nr:hypothetical protein [Sphaerisporangium siamense]MBB4704586.1 hypothetical protein [Sphaerisporangium siamense]GII86200.1 hypothetical protein Ssi03_41900 [Sphaerisporangium siamense]
MTHPTTAPEKVPPAWRVFRSDAGRLWATRVPPFPSSKWKFGVEPMVDADDLVSLARVMAEQESRAALAGEQ